MRRRGFDIEALANTKGSWLEKLSRNTNEIWIDADGNIPQKVCIGAKAALRTNRFTGRSWNEWEKTVPNRKRLIEELESSITEDGRYHIDWFWNTQSKRALNGHIITLEKIGGVLRYYDPQNGKVIDNFYDYIADIKLNRGIRLLRVDNLRVNPEYASQILGKSGSMAFGGMVGKSNIKGVKNPIPDEIKIRRSEIRDIAKETVVDKPIKLPGLNKTATISNKGVKEWTNQPHIHLAEKNELILDIQNVMNHSKYLGCGTDKNSINAVAHLFETVINGDKSWIVVREFYNGKIVIHSISDSDEILKIIKASTR